MEVFIKTELKDVEYRAKTRLGCENIFAMHHSSEKAAKHTMESR